MPWLFSETKELDDYSEEIIKMYNESYKKVGLINYGGWDNMKNYLHLSCYLLDENKQLQSIILYWLSDYGNKISLVISLNQEIAKKYTIPKLIELLRTPGFYAELSNNLEYLVRKQGMENIKDKHLILKVIPSITEKDIFEEGDERCNQYLLHREKNIPSHPYSYLRDIKDVGIHRKALYGLPIIQKTNKNN